MSGWQLGIVTVRLPGQTVSVSGGRIHGRAGYETKRTCLSLVEVAAYAAFGVGVDGN